MACKQDEVKRSSEVAMVLPDVSETVQGRKWVQMPHNVRGSSEAALIVWREFW